MKSQDIVILLKLASLQEQELHGEIAESLSREDRYSARGLETSLGISKSEVNAAINRSIASGLALKGRNFGRPTLNRRNLCNFIIHGLKFVFPAKPGAITRGISTSFAAPMLEKILMSAGEYIYVWPYANGKEMGQSVKPLFKSVPEAALQDVHLYEYLALVDAIRLGNQREVGLAGEWLSKKLLKQ